MFDKSVKLLLVASLLASTSLQAVIIEEIKEGASPAVGVKQQTPEEKESENQNTTSSTGHNPFEDKKDNNPSPLEMQKGNALTVSPKRDTKELIDVEKNYQKIITDQPGDTYFHTFFRRGAWVVCEGLKLGVNVLEMLNQGVDQGREMKKSFEEGYDLYTPTKEKLGETVGALEMAKESAITWWSQPSTLGPIEKNIIQGVGLKLAPEIENALFKGARYIAKESLVALLDWRGDVQSGLEKFGNFLMKMSNPYAMVSDILSYVDKGVHIANFMPEGIFGSLKSLAIQMVDGKMNVDANTLAGKQLALLRAQEKFAQEERKFRNIQEFSDDSEVQEIGATKSYDEAKEELHMAQINYDLSYKAANISEIMTAEGYLTTVKGIENSLKKTIGAFVADIEKHVEKVVGGNAAEGAKLVLRGIFLGQDSLKSELALLKKEILDWTPEFVKEYLEMAQNLTPNFVWQAKDVVVDVFSNSKVQTGISVVSKVGNVMGMATKYPLKIIKFLAPVQLKKAINKSISNYVYRPLANKIIDKVDEIVAPQIEGYVQNLNLKEPIIF
ncbi:hypothetical protein Bealeia1_00966 [Candidatus Bealeia paramacronuclearis]|uniref:Pre-toxin TG domain-containing protein n=1 Tax=Candidatus Bealeia paramacronuclearis TaxID=1921001 RepID=A0ABZ2C5A4_9PROT|nr:hypothetical protein [Candidatus Bealeia paramacronuclearis]